MPLANKVLFIFSARMYAASESVPLDFSDFPVPRLQRLKATICKIQKGPQNRLVYFASWGWAGATACFAG